MKSDKNSLTPARHDKDKIIVKSQLKIPFAYRISPDVERARRHGLDWAQKTRMVTSERAVVYWESLLLPEHAGLYWPYAIGRDIDLAVDCMTFYFFFDDQFDAELGESVPAVIRVIRDLSEITLNDTHSPSCVPAAVAFADLWHRIVEGMSPEWVQRAGRHWREYLFGYVSEAVDRQCGTAHQIDTYLAGRRYSVGAQTSTDLCERFGHFEVPEEALAHPNLQLMRQITCDLLVISNDLQSFDKETERGEINNFVAVTCRMRDLPPHAAIQQVRAESERMLERFIELEQAMPRIIDAFGSPVYSDTIATYIDALKASIRGYDAWGNMTPRYDIDRTPGSALAYMEDLTRGQP